MYSTLAATASKVQSDIEEPQGRGKRRGGSKNERDRRYFDEDEDFSNRRPHYDDVEWDDGDNDFRRPDDYGSDDREPYASYEHDERWMKYDEDSMYDR